MQAHSISFPWLHSEGTRGLESKVWIFFLLVIACCLLLIILSSSSFYCLFNNFIQCCCLNPDTQSSCLEVKYEIAFFFCKCTQEQHISQQLFNSSPSVLAVPHGPSVMWQVKWSRDEKKITAWLKLVPQLKTYLSYAAILCCSHMENWCNSVRALRCWRLVLAPWACQGEISVTVEMKQH